MLGLGSLFGSGGIFGKLLDSVGLGWMNNIMSLAADVMTGNWLAAAKDVFTLVSQFSSGNSWMNSVSTFPPVGEFSTDGCFSSGGLSQTRAQDLRLQADSNEVQGLQNYSRAIYTVSETVQNNAAANASVRQAQMNQHA